jgi:hypothetical protein
VTGVSTAYRNDKNDTDDSCLPAKTRSCRQTLHGRHIVSAPQYLHELNDHLLRDIGLSRQNLAFDVECKKPNRHQRHPSLLKLSTTAVLISVVLALALSLKVGELRQGILLIDPQRPLPQFQTLP